jgi:AcrR family transcriptional regulator
MSAECVSASDRPLRADAERNRLRILEAAAEVFARRGLDAGLDEIARHAGVGTGTVYRRFPDKRLLLQALVEQRMTEVEELAETAVRMPDAWAGLVHFVETFTERAIADRSLGDICFSGGADSEALADRKARIGPLMAELVERAKQQGAVRPDLAVTDIAMLQFMLMAGGEFGDGVRPDLWRRHLAIFLDGLRLRRDTPTPLPAEPMSMDELELVCGGATPPGRRPAARPEPAR